MTLRPHFSRGEGGTLITSTLSIRRYDAQFGYNRKVVLDSWLGAGGHALWVSAKKESDHMHHAHHMHHMPPMAHMHAKYPYDGSSELIYRHFDRNNFANGLHKVWFQFRLEGQVISVPFIFEVEAF